jgi:hypothetical protein
VIIEYSEQTITNKEFGDVSTGAVLYFCTRKYCRGHGGQGGGCGCGRGNRCQKLKFTHNKMENHTTEAWGKRSHTETDTNTSRNDMRTCYNCGLTVHIKANQVHFKHARNQPNKVNNGTLSALLFTAGDVDLTRLAEMSTALTPASAPTTFVIDCGESRHICNDSTRFNPIKTLRQPLIIELGAYYKVAVCQHGLSNIPQEYIVNDLHMQTFRLSLLSINRLDTAGYKPTFGYGILLHILSINYSHSQSSQ